MRPASACLLRSLVCIQGCRLRFPAGGSFNGAFSFGSLDHWVFFFRFKMNRKKSSIWKNRANRGRSVINEALRDRTATNLSVLIHDAVLNDSLNQWDAPVRSRDFFPQTHGVIIHASAEFLSNGEHMNIKTSHPPLCSCWDQVNEPSSCYLWQRPQGEITDIIIIPFSNPLAHDLKAN